MENSSLPSIKKIKTLIKSIEKKKSISSMSIFVKVFRKTINEEELIEDSKLCNEIMLFSILRFPAILKEILKLPDDIENYKIKNKRVETIIKVYLTNLYKFIDQLSDEKILQFVLKNMIEIPTLLYISKEVFKKKFIKLFLNIWGTHESILVKLNAFVILREYIKINSSKNQETILKQMYLIFTDSAKVVTWRNYELLIFMTNCFIELVGLNLETTYFVAFKLISQKATILKNVLKEKNKETIHQIYCWKFWNSIKIWISAIITYPKELGELLLPIIQLSSGLLEIYQNSKYFPLFIHIIKDLNNISAKTGIYIPLVKNIICQMLSNSDFQHRKRNDKSKVFDFEINIKAQKEQLETNGYWNQVFNELIDILLENLSLFQRKIHYPELCTFIHQKLKKLQKQFVFNYYKMKIKTALQLIQSTHPDIISIRKTTGLKPENKEKCHDFELKLKKTALDEEILRIKNEKETLKRQKILAEKEEAEAEEKESISLSSEKPLSEEDLDLE